MTLKYFLELDWFYRLIAGLYAVAGVLLVMCAMKSTAQTAEAPKMKKKTLEVTQRYFDEITKKHVVRFVFRDVEQEVTSKCKIECARLVAHFALLPLEKIEFRGMYGKGKRIDGD